MAAFTLEDENRNGIHVLHARGSLTLGVGNPVLRETIKNLAGGAPLLIVLDLGETSYIDSAGLGELVSSYTSITSTGGRLALAALQKRVVDLLKITKLLTVFEVFDTVEQAVAGLTPRLTRRALLEQATFGVTASDVAHVQSIGIDAYISEQLAYPPTQYTGYTYTPHTAPVELQERWIESARCIQPVRARSVQPFQVQRDFFTHALNNPDQLRQRVAFALSQIMVVSSVEIYEAYGLADYQNMLLNDALGNYRTLLQDVTLEPDHGSLPRHGEQRRRPIRKTARSPIKIMAREVLQLFSIGLSS
jgi:anti-anti-sigma factor